MLLALLKLKSTFKKVWFWLKHHWYVPLLILAFIIAILVWALTKNGAYVAALIDVLENSRASYKKEIENLNEIHNRETAEKKRILKEYNKTIERLEEEYAEKDQQLNEDKKKEIKKLVEEGYNDPERLSREIARLFGIEHG